MKRYYFARRNKIIDVVIKNLYHITNGEIYMMRYLALLLMLTGCMAAYEPKLVTPVINSNQYTADLESCKQEAHDRIINAGYSSEGLAKSGLAGVFGIAGAVVGSAIPNDNSDYSKTGFTMVDECMTKMGYDIAKD